MSNLPTITVITVCYNESRHLEGTIKSILSQTYPNYEYIIIDGGSSDGTLDVIKVYEADINLIVTESDNGIYDAMNKGGLLATGEWIIFMNAGDYLFSRSSLEEMSTHLNGDYVYGNVAEYARDVDSPKFLGARDGGFGNLPYCHQALFLKREVFLQYRFNIGYAISADYDQYLRMLFGGKIGKKVNLSVARVLAGGISQRNKELIIWEYFCILKRYKPTYSYCLFAFRVFKLLMWKTFSIANRETRC